MKGFIAFLKDTFDVELVAILMLTGIAVGAATCVGMVHAMNRSLSDLDESLMRLESAVDDLDSTIEDLDRTLGR